MVEKKNVGDGKDGQIFNHLGRRNSCSSNISFHIRHG
ncbi:hypothetical protein COLO4_07690 [Corchorus olitorius]|uniref:Uncharacterized protein n=1 Tax=Corchorus olitorius TaxID=93759 RepID=A0A1R3KJ09_9ROSI|nr:hypothetical protein COLO4_07690 [Corchorus olitorius]